MKHLVLKLTVALLAFAVGVASLLISEGLRALPEAARTALYGSPRSDTLRLYLSTPEPRVRVGEVPRVQVTITNVGSEPVTLVHPGDGSESGWRTPVTGWSIVDAKDYAPVPIDSVRDCGNINALSSGEAFRLAPGEVVKLRDWVYLPPFRRPGAYKVNFSYSNRPSLEWSGVPLGRHDPVAMWRVRNSTECSLLSNEVVFSVVE